MSQNSICDGLFWVSMGRKKVLCGAICDFKSIFRVHFFFGRHLLTNEKLIFQLFQPIRSENNESPKKMVWKEKTKTQSNNDFKSVRRRNIKKMVTTLNGGAVGRRVLSQERDHWNVFLFRCNCSGWCTQTLRCRIQLNKRWMGNHISTSGKRTLQDLMETQRNNCVLRYFFCLLIGYPSSCSLSCICMNHQKIFHWAYYFILFA